MVLNGHISKTQPIAASHGTVLPGWWCELRFPNGGSTSVPPHGTANRLVWSTMMVLKLILVKHGIEPPIDFYGALR